MLGAEVTAETVLPVAVSGACPRAGRKIPESFPSLPQSPIINIKHLHFMSLLPLSSHTYLGISWISYFGSHNNSLCPIGSPTLGGCTFFAQLAEINICHATSGAPSHHASYPRSLSWKASSFPILFIITSLLTNLGSLVPGQPALQALQISNNPFSGWTHVNPAQDLPACFIC